MELELTGRHVEVTPALKAFAREKLIKLQKWIDDPMEIHAILTVEKRRHIAEIVVRSRVLSFSAKHVTPDMYTSIGECVDKLERQAKKQKEKFEARRRRSLRAETPGAGEAAPAKKRAPVRRSRTGAAQADGRPRIIKSDLFPRKPMSVEEAALQVKDYGVDFIVFRNERSQEINVLYVMKDGTLGLIEP